MKSTPSTDPLDYEYPCNDCGVDVLAIGDWYLATPEIWKQQLGLGWNDNLCIACLDKTARPQSAAAGYLACAR
jgi:hypothetical protein